MSFQSLRKKTDRFLSCRRIAVIGVSKTSPQEPVNLNYKKLAAAGYTVIPVNPKYQEFEGKVCYPAVGVIPEPVEAALIFTPPGVTRQAVKDCIDAGVRNIWVHKGIGKGSHSESATAFLKQQPDVNLIDGACPMMFIPNGDWFHKSFRTVLKWTGGLPA